MAGGWAKLCKAPSPSPQHPLYKTLEDSTGLSWVKQCGQGGRDCYWRDFVKPGQSRFPEAGRWRIGMGMDAGGQEDCCASRCRNPSWLSSSSQGQCLRKGPQKHVPTASYPAKSRKVCSIDCWVSIFFFFYYKDTFYTGIQRTSGYCWHPFQLTDCHVAC